ncbi:hypothetical protein [Flavivirga algicola]|uniref:Uncharacterized protein n=1 Tax=Flavivirga algicola TaxID=2729136 RepID=A0ABX1RVN9_9FLAO|nr:hypothetical protein [Flavivirga algicola]NMH87231.1 hypothetical protein [Flavivirga algicola]
MKKKGGLLLFPSNKHNKINNRLFYDELIAKEELNNNKGDIKLLKKLEKEIIKKGVKPVSSYILQSYIKRAFPVMTLIFGAFAAVQIKSQYLSK